MLAYPHGSNVTIVDFISGLRKMTETKPKKCYVVGFEDAR